MSDPVTITCELDANALAILERAQSFPDRILPAIARGLTYGLALAVGQIQQERFTGQGPFPAADGKLGVRTNRLRASIRSTQATISGSEVQASAGSNVEYFGVHEFGFDGDVQVPSFTRKVSASQFAKAGSVPADEKVYKNQYGTYSKRAKKDLGTETVKAHVRHLRMPARAPLGHGLADHLTQINRAIGRAVSASWKQEGGES